MFRISRAPAEPISTTSCASKPRRWSSRVAARTHVVTRRKTPASFGGRRTMSGFSLHQAGRRAMQALAIGIAAALPTAAFAQDADVATELLCQRYIQAQERVNTIPVGLLTAISLVESGRRGDDG